MNEILSNLKEFGIDESASKIYIHLLKNPDSPAYKIATATTIPRTTVYKILEHLEAQGLINCWKKNSVKHYSAENPENLRRILKKKEAALESVFGDLKNLFQSKQNSPETKVLIGKEGIKYAFNHVLDTMIQEKIKIVYAISEKALTDTLPRFFIEWREKKNKKSNAITYLIVPEGLSQEQNYKSDEYRVTREMPGENPIEGSVDIIGPNTYFFSFKEGEIYSIIIESRIISEMLKNMFMYIWKTLEPKNPQAN